MQKRVSAGIWVFVAVFVIYRPISRLWSLVEFDSDVTISGLFELLFCFCDREKGEYVLAFFCAFGPFSQTKFFEDFL
jgi:hypothetical protein